MKKIWGFLLIFLLVSFPIYAEEKYQQIIELAVFYDSPSFNYQGDLILPFCFKTSDKFDKLRCINSSSPSYINHSMEPDNSGKKIYYVENTYQRGPKNLTLSYKNEAAEERGFSIFVDRQCSYFFESNYNLRSENKAGRLVIVVVLRQEANKLLISGCNTYKRESHKAQQRHYPFYNIFPYQDSELLDVEFKEK